MGVNGYTKAGVTSPAYGTLMLICCGITFGCYFAAFMRLPVVPLQAQALGVDTGRIGVINAAFFIMAGLLSLPLGMVVDRWGHKRMAAAGLLVLAAASGALSICRTFMDFTLAYLMLGIGIAAFGPTMMTLVAVISPPSHLGRAYGWYTTAIFCGMSLGPAVGGVLARSLGAPQVFLAASFLLVTDVFFLSRFLPRHLEPAENSASRGNTTDGLGTLFKNRPLMGCWLMTLGACFGLGMFTSFIPLHAQGRGLDVGQIGIIFSVQGLCNGVSRIPFGRLSDHVARRGNLVVIGIALYVTALVGCGWAATMMSFVLAAGLVGVGMGLAFTSVGALIAEVVPAASRGSAMGGYNTCIYLGMMLSSVLMGKVCEMTGFAVGFYLTAGVNLLCVIIFYGLSKTSAELRG
jgi:DHA1 family multidrug resistance protein-like MFS transporter